MTKRQRERLRLTGYAVLMLCALVNPYILARTPALPPQDEDPLSKHRFFWEESKSKKRGNKNLK